MRVCMCTILTMIKNVAVPTSLTLNSYEVLKALTLKFLPVVSYFLIHSLSTFDMVN